MLGWPDSGASALAGAPRAVETGTPVPPSPLSIAVYRSLWIATIVANIGTCMKDVAAGWLMTTLSPSPLLVALVQAATI